MRLSSGPPHKNSATKWCDPSVICKEKNFVLLHATQYFSPWKPSLLALVRFYPSPFGGLLAASTLYWGSSGKSSAGLKVYSSKVDHSCAFICYLTMIVYPLHARRLSTVYVPSQKIVRIFQIQQPQKGALFVSVIQIKMRLIFRQASRHGNVRALLCARCNFFLSPWALRNFRHRERRRSLAHVLLDPWPLRCCPQLCCSLYLCYRWWGQRRRQWGGGGGGGGGRAFHRLCFWQYKIFLAKNALPSRRRWMRRLKKLYAGCLHVSSRSKLHGLTRRWCERSVPWTPTL